MTTGRINQVRRESEMKDKLLPPKSTHLRVRSTGGAVAFFLTDEDRNGWVADTFHTGFDAVCGTYSLALDEFFFECVEKRRKQFLYKERDRVPTSSQHIISLSCPSVQIEGHWLSGRG